MFRYPCSFLIYSDAFAALPVGVKSRVWRRLEEIVSGEDTSARFDHITAEDRKAIREILRDTHREAENLGPAAAGP